MNSPTERRGVWSIDEHERFLEAVAMFPSGPWHVITAHIGTRSAKQVQTHAQKYQHKLRRHQRGLRKCKTKSKRPEHRVDAATIDVLLRPPDRKNERSRSRLSSELELEEGESSDWSDSSGYLDVIEPIPFRSASIGKLSDQERTDIRDALDVILSWSPPSPASTDACV